MCKTTVKAILLITLALCGMAALDAQEVFIEHHGAGTAIIAVIPQKTFIFERQNRTSDYQISIEIKDKKKKQVARHERLLSVPRTEALNSAAVMVEFQTQLAAGDYDLSLIIRNSKLGDRRSLTKAFGIAISSMQIGQAYLIGETGGIKYLLSDYEQMSYGFEKRYLYQNMSLVLDSMRVDIDGNVYSYRALNSTNILILDHEFGFDNVQNISINYYENSILYKAEPFLYGAWYSYGSKYSLKDQIEQLRYIATQNEWNTLRRLPVSRYYEAIEQFWEKHDPSPGTQRNEAREEFYRRVISADERYTIHARLKGWKSDRGRIYIKYGVPDEETSEAYPLDSPPYVIWFYYAQNRRFVFVDAKGFGQYTLSNKEEEYNGF